MTLTTRIRQAAPGQPGPSVITQSSAMPSSVPIVPRSSTRGWAPVRTTPFGQASASTERPSSAGRVITSAPDPAAASTPCGVQVAGSKPGNGSASVCPPVAISTSTSSDPRSTMALAGL